MTKITYLLGAGASYNSCPIWENQSTQMTEIAKLLLIKITNPKSHFKQKTINFSEEERQYLQNDLEELIWHMGYFGVKGKEFGTVDTYARKLFLQQDSNLSLLKMSVSFFFDIWENFYTKEFKHFFKERNGLWDDSIDKRYISMLSVYLDKVGNEIKLDKNISFVTWNYDLQLEGALKQFIERDKEITFDNLGNEFPFKEDNSTQIKNTVYHLNGYRGYFRSGEIDTLLREKEDLDSYLKTWNDLFSTTRRKKTSFNSFIKYAWEQELSNNWINSISQILKETEILIVVGYSFPLFNRKIDQHLFSHFHQNRLKKIVYQDPNATEEKILNLFRNPDAFKKKIQLREEVDQFHIPHSHFIEQKDLSPEVR